MSSANYIKLLRDANILGERESNEEIKVDPVDADLVFVIVKSPKI